MILLYSYSTVSCDPPPLNSLPAGLLLLSVRRDVLLFQCGLRYTPHEVVTASCEQGGVWSPNPITYTCDLSVPSIGTYVAKKCCMLGILTMIIIDCGSPVPPTNGKIEGHSNTSEGASVTFQCNDGYFPSTVRTSIVLEMDGVHYQ